MNKKINHNTKSVQKLIGTLGEEFAAKYFIKKDYQILAKNYSGRGYEIDLIVKKDSCITFVEVKTMSNRHNFLKDHIHFLNRKKVASIKHGLNEFISSYKHQYNTLSLDLLLIYLICEQEYKIHHHENILELVE